MQVWIEPSVYGELKSLPGHIRQRIRRSIKTLGSNPHPHNSKMLEMSPELQFPGLVACRVRLDNCRIVYAIDEEWDTITILAVRRRPPYDYDDLPELLSEL